MIWVPSRSPEAGAATRLKPSPADRKFTGLRRGEPPAAVRSVNKADAPRLRYPVAESVSLLTVRLPLESDMSPSKAFICPLVMTAVVDCKVMGPASDSTKPVFVKIFAQNMSPPPLNIVPPLTTDCHGPSPKEGLLGSWRVWKNAALSV